VGIAQAIIHKPDVIILDEPTVGLDPNQIKEVRSLVKNLAGQHTIILSTHILSEVEISCDRVVIIDKGRIADIDTTQNLAAKYKQGERVKVVVKGEEAGLRRLLESLDGVNQVEVEKDGHGQVGAIVESAQGIDLRVPIAARITNAGLELLELRAVNLSLEDIFMRLTTKEEQEVKVEEPEKVEKSEEAVEKSKEAEEPEKVETAEKAD
jgi:ABC-2 type transport system ATP-binding protein